MRFGQVKSKTFFSKLMKGYVTKNVKKDFPTSFQGLLMGMKDFPETVSKEGPQSVQV